MTTAARDLRTHPVHLGLGARAEIQPAFTGAEWYEAYGQRVAADGVEGRLVALHDFTGNWESWEVHPLGDEVVICVSGEMTLIQELQDGTLHSETIRAGKCIINPAGVWHTANIPHAASALFITAGEGTHNRPR